MVDYDDYIQENGPWSVHLIRDNNGHLRVDLWSDDFHHDAGLTIHGDFGTEEIKIQYAEEICRRLNVMNPKQG